MSVRTILIVDDDTQMQRVMRVSLKAEGYGAECIQTGEEALERVRAGKFDLVLLDINLPGISGLSACRQIRSFSAIPIIMMTVRDAEKDKVQALDALHVLPDHSEVGDGTLVAKERAFIVDLDTRALDLKRQGVLVEDAGERLTADFKARYPEWQIASVSGFVQTVYAE